MIKKTYREVTMNYTLKISESVAFLKQKLTTTPTLGLVLGSGLGDLSQHWL